MSAFRFESSSAMPLCAMSISDSICLISLFSQASFHVMFQILDLHRNSNAASFFCKVFLTQIKVVNNWVVLDWLVFNSHDFCLFIMVLVNFVDFEIYCSVLSGSLIEWICLYECFLVQISHHLEVTAIHIKIYIVSKFTLCNSTCFY